MPDSAPMSPTHPVMVAWTAYKATPEYENALRWAKEPTGAHVEGSLWAAFLEGHEAARRRFDPGMAQTLDEGFRQAAGDASQ